MKDGANKATTCAAVVALGNWGTALGHHLACRGLDVLAWSNDPEIVDAVNCRHRNPKFLSSAALDPRLKATLDIGRLQAAHIVVVALPSEALPEVLPKLKVSSDALVVSAVKGLVGNDLLTPLQYFEKCGLGGFGHVVLSGPSFARDIVRQLPSGVVAAAMQEEPAKKVADIFSNEAMRVYTSLDPLGVELGGIVKNVIALAVGVCDGLELGDSARAGLITRGLAEMMRLADAMGAQKLTLSGLSGLGDLVMTATCDTSRNRTVGLRLGRGEPLRQILDSLGSVAEGVSTTPLVLKLAEKVGVEMPITAQVARLLRNEGTAAELAKALIARPLKREF